MAALLLALAAAVIAASLSGIVPAVAQVNSVSVAGFDRNGLEVEVLASFEAGGEPTTLYRRVLGAGFALGGVGLAGGAP